MSVDKAIVNVEDENNLGDVEFNSGDTLFNKIYISTKTKKGSRYEDKNFGSEFHKLEKSGKVTEETIQLSEQYAEACTKWIVDNRYAQKITVKASENSVALGRIDLRWDVIKPNGKPKTYNTWYNVI